LDGPIQEIFSPVPQTTPYPGSTRSRLGGSAIGPSSDFELKRSRLSEGNELGRTLACRYSPAIAVGIMAERKPRDRGTGGVSLGHVDCRRPRAEGSGFLVTATETSARGEEVGGLRRHISTDRTQAPRTVDKSSTRRPSGFVQRARSNSVGRQGSDLVRADLSFALVLEPVPLEP
jgi:hypothetical protein